MMPLNDFGDTQTFPVFLYWDTLINIQRSDYESEECANPFFFTFWIQLPSFQTQIRENQWLVRHKRQDLGVDAPVVGALWLQEA